MQPAGSPYILWGPSLKTRSDTNHGPELAIGCFRLEATSSRLTGPAFGLLSVSVSSSPGLEGSVKPPGQLAPQLLFGAFGGCEKCLQYGSSVLWGTKNKL